MAETPNLQIVMGYVREQLEAYREDVSSRLHVISKRLAQHTKREQAVQDKLGGIVDVLESTVDVFLRHDCAMEMQLRASRLWIFLSLLSKSDPSKETQVLKLINQTKESLNARLNDLWKAPIEEVVPIRNGFREQIQQLAKESGILV